MKRINFDVVYKIIVLLLLSIILIICSNKPEYEPEPTAVGKYKEIKIKKSDYRGVEFEEVLILDTETGMTRHPN